MLAIKFSDESRFCFYESFVIDRVYSLFICSYTAVGYLKKIIATPIRITSAHQHCVSL